MNNVIDIIVNIPQANLLIFAGILLLFLAIGITFNNNKIIIRNINSKLALLIGSIFLIIGLMLQVLPNNFVTTNGKTTINLNGNWELLLTTSKNEKRKGEAIIKQKRGNIRLKIIGKIESTTKPPFISFSSLVAILKNSRLVFLYETSDRQMGIALGDIYSNNPKTFNVKYYDVSSTDTNKDPEGGIEFLRR